MKVIHTYASSTIVWKEQFYVMLLSALYAKKHYGNIHLFCTKPIAEQLESIESFYSDITIIPNSSSSTYSLPKINTYASQTEPFLHLDHDSILFNKVDFEQSGSPFVFSHPDMKDLVNKKGKLGYHIPLMYGKGNTDYKYVKRAYLELIDKLEEKIPGILIPFDTIPNMALVYVNRPNVFSRVAEYALSYYEQNKTVLDAHDFGAHHLEQYLMHHLLYAENKEYRKAAKKFRTFLIPKVPLTVNFKQQDKVKASIQDTQFPFSIETYNTYPYFNQKKSVKHTFEKPEDIANLFGNHFGGYIHFSYLQWYQILQPYVLNEIVTNFGENYVLSAHKYFKEKYEESDLPTKSEGEKLFEQLTNFSFE